jgi:hypothetical protein
MAATPDPLLHGRHAASHAAVAHVKGEGALKVNQKGAMLFVTLSGLLGEGRRPAM